MLYSPGMKIHCGISADIGEGYPESSSLPGVAMLEVQNPGEYTVYITKFDEYQIYINAE